MEKVMQNWLKMSTLKIFFLEKSLNKIIFIEKQMLMIFFTFTIKNDFRNM